MKLNWNMLSKYRNQLYALSIFWVFVFHIDESFSKLMIFERTPKFIIKSGNTGVDIFLFLSGISMYYAMKKNTGLWHFYKRRYVKILKIYVFFCVPYFVAYYLSGNMSYQAFIKQITFTRQRVSSFWFLLCVLICYTVYPLIYKLLCANRIKIIWGGILLYILGLMWMKSAYPLVYSYDEILTTRIPVFIVGSIAGKSVYEKKEIPVPLLFLLLFCLLGKDVMNYLYSSVAFFGTYKDLITRLFSGLMGIGAIFFMVILLRYLEGTKAERVLSWFGKITLEFYVTHIAFRHILLDILKIKVTSFKGVVVFSAGLFALSLAVSVFLNWLLYQPHTRRASRD